MILQFVKPAFSGLFTKQLQPDSVVSYCFWVVFLALEESDNPDSGSDCLYRDLRKNGLKRYIFTELEAEFINL